MPVSKHKTDATDHIKTLECPNVNCVNRKAEHINVDDEAVERGGTLHIYKEERIAWCTFLWKTQS